VNRVEAESGGHELYFWPVKKAGTQSSQMPSSPYPHSTSESEDSLSPIRSIKLEGLFLPRFVTRSMLTLAIVLEEEKW
jgi:hypothetical protein